MKKFNFLIYLWLYLAIYPAFADEVDISSKITNPGFENDLTGWTVQNGSDGSNTITPVSATDQKKSGSKSVKFPLNYGNQITTEARVYQVITGLTPGNYILKAYVRGKRWEKDNGIFANGGSGDAKENTDFNSPSNISASWNLVSIAFTVGSTGNATIGGYASKRRSASDRTNDFWIDDFQLFHIEEGGTSGGDTDCNVTLVQKNLVTRDNNANGFGNDLFTSIETKDGSTLEADRDNPDKTGINTTNKCLFSKGGDVNWYSYGKISGNAVTVDATYRYLHVMVRAGKSTDPGHEYDNSGNAMLVIRTGSDDTPGNYQGDGKATDIRIDITTEWKELVFDLQERGISQIYGFYLGDQNWTNNHKREIFWDQFILNNKPCTIDGETDEGGETGGETGNASVLADFETGGVIPSYSDNGGCASNSPVVVDNPDKTCTLNTTNKALYAKTNGSSQEWWKGIEIDIADFTVATSTARYLHILMRTDLPKFEWDVHTNGDKWVGASSDHAVSNTWFDCVIDLQEIKGTENLNGQTVTALRIAFSCNEESNRNKEVWIDEIILSNDVAVRGVCSTAPTTPTITINPATQYQTIEGFGASDCWMGNFVGKWSGNNKATVAKWLFSQNFNSSGNPEGIGLSIWRMNLGAGTYELGDTGNNVGDGVDSRVARRAESFLTDVSTAGTYDWGKCAGQQYFLQQAKNYGCESFVAFSNSPLVTFTRNGQGYGPDKTNANIQSDKYDDFADYLVDVVKHFKDEGYNFNYISPLNEPQWDWNTKEQEGTHWTNTEIKTMITNLNSSIINKGLTGTKIMLPEAGRWECLYGTGGGSPNNQIYDFFDAASSNHIGHLANVAQSIAGHSYWTDKTNSSIKSVRQSVKSKAAQYNLSVAQTEWSMMEDSGIDGLPSSYSYIDVALNMAKIIHSDLAYADVTSWSYWTAMYMEQWNQKNRFMLVHVKPSDNEYANTYSALETQGAIEAEPNLWALGNYSLFVRPGYIRIALSGAEDLGGLMGTAYIAPDNSKIVAVYVNMGNSAKTVSVTFDNSGNLTPSQYTGYETSASHSLEKIFSGSYTTENTLSVAARSVLTVVYDINQPRFIWQGTSGTQWTEAANWIDNTAPAATDTVLIPAGCSNYPVLTAGQTAKHVSIEKGANIDLNGYTLSVTEGVKVIMPVTASASDNSVAFNSWFPVGFPFTVETVGSYNFEIEGYEPSNLYPYEDNEDDLQNPPYNTNPGWLGDYWLKEYIYDGSGNSPFHYTQDAFVAGKGYIIKLPDWFEEDIISFMSSASSIVFAGTPVEPCAEYKLVANNSFKDIKLNNSGNTYYYAFVPADNAFKLITGETTIRPFEAYIAVTVDNPNTSLRSSFAVDGMMPTLILNPASQIDDPVVSERYYNLQGIEIAQPVDSEIYIVCRTLQSGAIKTIKQLKIKN